MIGTARYWRIFLFAFFLVIGVTGFQSVFAEKKEFSYKERREVSHAMRMLQINTENLHIAFEKRDWEEMGKLAMAVHDACAGLSSRGDMDVPLEFDDFRLFSENLHDYAEEIIAASKVQDNERAKTAYKKMEKTCVGCHKRFR